MNITEEDKDKAKDATIIEEDVPRLVRVVMQTKIPPRSKENVSVATDTKCPVQMSPLQEPDSTHA